MKSRGREPKRIKTVLGDIAFHRSLFVCPVCGPGRFPGDEVLDVVRTGFSPGVRRLMARAGQRDTFKEGRDDLQEFAGIRVTAKDVERVSEGTGKEIEIWQSQERSLILKEKQNPEVSDKIPVLYVSYDGTGVPMVPWETAGRKGMQADGSCRTREVKLGCVFTQTTVDPQGRPVRDDASTSFVGAIESSEEFGWRIYGEAVRRGLEFARKVVVIADGARYNWEIASFHFPGAIEIVDLYHAREHLHDLCVLLVPGSSRELIRLETRWRTMFDEGKVEKIIKEAQRRLPRDKERHEAAQKEIGYFMNNASRMRYGQYHSQCLFVGSGVVEAGCKTVIGKRLKQSGMQ
ncbi:MAG: ISKra4 family transposase [Deltaproteobacteria bacterium]|nr:ISKra4 family transposase [Deltaproteobacteria bacterium]